MMGPKIAAEEASETRKRTERAEGRIGMRTCRLCKKPVPEAEMTRAHGVTYHEACYWRQRAEHAEQVVQEMENYLPEPGAMHVIRRCPECGERLAVELRLPVTEGTIVAHGCGRRFPVLKATPA